MRRSCFHTAWVILLSSVAVCAVVGVGIEREVCAQQDEVIMSLDGSVFENPDGRSRVLLRVQAGDRFTVLADNGDWVQVRLPRGTGWVLRKIVHRANEQPPPTGLPEQGGESVTIIDEPTNLKAGPGDGYMCSASLFRGDTYRVLGRSDDGEWVELDVRGSRGWVRADQVMAANSVVPGGNNARPPLGGNPNGGANTVGGGVGPAVGVGGEVAPGAEGEELPLKLEVRVGGTMQFATQAFRSTFVDGGIPANPLLGQYNLTTTMFGSHLHARAWIFDYLGVVTEYALSFGQVDGDLAPINQAPQQITNTTHRFHGGVTGRFPIGDKERPYWVGATAGFLFHRFSFQALQPQDINENALPPIFVTNTYTGPKLSLEVGVPIGPVDVWGGFGLIFGSLDQGDFLTGDMQALSLISGEAGASFEVAPDIGIFVMGTFDNYAANFGAVNAVSAREEAIDLATNLDRFTQISAGVRWKPL